MRRPTLIVMVKEPRPGRVKTRLGTEIGMTDAARWVERLRAEPAVERGTLGGELEELQFFSLPAGHRGPGGAVD